MNYFDDWTDDELDDEIQLGSGGPARELYLAEQKRREDEAKAIQEVVSKLLKD